MLHNDWKIMDGKQWMKIMDEKSPCRASQALTRWLTQGPQCWTHIPATGEAFYSHGNFLLKQNFLLFSTKKERSRTRNVVWVKKVYWSIGWVDWLVVTNSYQSAVPTIQKLLLMTSPAKVLRDLLWPREVKITLKR